MVIFFCFIIYYDAAVAACSVSVRRASTSMRSSILSVQRTVFSLFISGSCVHFAQSVELVTFTTWLVRSIRMFLSIFLSDLWTFRMCPRYSWRAKLYATVFLSLFRVYFEARFSFSWLGFFHFVFHRCKSLCSVAFCHFASFSTKTKVRLVYFPFE